MAFTFTIDAAYPETGGFDVAGGHIGYLFHDFGAGIFAGQPTYAWTGLSPTALAAAAVWMRSAGAVTLGATVGEGVSHGSQSLTVPLTGAVSSGRYLLLMLGMLADLANGTVLPDTDIAVTDTRGGNALLFGGNTDIGFAWSAQEGFVGGWQAGWGDFWRINNALTTSDSLTVTISGVTVYELHARLHILNGVDLANPLGPNPGGNLVQFGDNDGTPTTPFTRIAPPVPNWLGGTLNVANQWVATKGDYTVALARGGIASIAPAGFDLLGRNMVDQMALPEIVLDSGCTLEIASCDTDGFVRTSDEISDVRLWVEEE